MFAGSTHYRRVNFILTCLIQCDRARAHPRTHLTGLHPIMQISEWWVSQELARLLVSWCNVTINNNRWNIFDFLHLQVIEYAWLFVSWYRIASETKIRRGINRPQMGRLDAVSLCSAQFRKRSEVSRPKRPRLLFQLLLHVCVYLEESSWCRVTAQYFIHDVVVGFHQYSIYRASPQ